MKRIPKFLWFMLLLPLPAVAGEEPVGLGVLVSGEVAEVVVKPGQRVVAGDLLVKMDERLFKARVAEARARLAAAQAALEQAGRELERAQELYERALLSDYELKEAEVSHLKARAERAAAAGRLLEAQIELEHCRLLAPFDGRVARVIAWKGLQVQNSQRIQPLVELVREAGP